MLTNCRGVQPEFFFENSGNIPPFPFSSQSFLSHRSSSPSENSPRVTVFVNALKEGLKEKRPLSNVEYTKIASFVDKYFAKSQDASKKFEYISSKSSKMPRGLVLDYSKKRFLVLSKKQSIFNFVGSERKFTTATLFFQNGNKMEYKQYACLTNIEPESVESMKWQADLADDIYQDILLRVEYTSRKHKKKIIIFEELYDTTVGKALKEDALSPGQISSIFRQVIKTLTFLHKNGYAHGDITTDNILLKELQGEAVKSKLTDFGNAYNPDDAKPRKTLNSYGTSSYSAPELFEASQPLDDPFEKGKAEDMFALGCALYLMLFPQHKRLPWYYEVDRAILKPSQETKEAAAKKYREALETLEQELSSEPDCERQKLLNTAFHLLACDPRSRWRIEDLSDF